MHPLDSKTTNHRLPLFRRRKNNKDFVIALVVGLILAAIVGGFLYYSSLKQHFPT